MSRGTVGVKDRARVLELPSGNDAASGSAGLSPSGRARFRYNDITKQVEASVDGGPYGPFASGQGGVTAALATTPNITNAGIVAIAAPTVQGPAAKVIWFTTAMLLQNDRITVTLERNGVTILESYSIQQGSIGFTFNAHWTDEAPPTGDVIYRVSMVSLDTETSSLDNRRITVKDL